MASRRSSARDGRPSASGPIRRQSLRSSQAIELMFGVQTVPASSRGHRPLLRRTPPVRLAAWTWEKPTPSLSSSASHPPKRVLWPVLSPTARGALPSSPSRHGDLNQTRCTAAGLARNDIMNRKKISFYHVVRHAVRSLNFLVPVYVGSLNMHLCSLHR